MQLMLYTYGLKTSLSNCIMPKMLNYIEKDLHKLHAIDILPKNVKEKLIEKVMSRSKMQTGGLATVFC